MPKLLLTLAAALFAAAMTASAAHASHSQPTATDEEVDRFIATMIGQTERTYPGFEFIDGGMADDRAFLMVFARPGKDPDTLWQLVRSFTIDPARTHPVRDHVALWQIDCKADAFRVLQLTLHTLDQETVRTSSPPYDKAWQFVVPDTIFESVLRWGCSVWNPNPQASGKSSAP